MIIGFGGQAGDGMSKVLVVADDMTGANDTGALFSKKRFSCRHGPPPGAFPETSGRESGAVHQHGHQGGGAGACAGSGKKGGRAVWGQRDADL